MMDLDNYIETQSRILTSETMALQTIRKLMSQSLRNLTGLERRTRSSLVPWKTRKCRRKSGHFWAA